jgi:hypothetical protein
MALFAIIGIDPKPGLAAAVERDYAGKFVVVASNHWIVNGEGTAKSVSDNLGVRGGSLGNVIIYNVAGYYGFAPTNLWEWLKSSGMQGE